MTSVSAGSQQLVIPGPDALKTPNMGSKNPNRPYDVGFEITR